MTTAQLTSRTSPIQPGQTAPDFTLNDQDGNPWTLSEALDSGDVVLCFYPLDFSPVCSEEMRCASGEFGSFIDCGAQVVGISGDSSYAHKAWSAQLGLEQVLLADMHRDVCKAYGFYFEKRNVPSRGTVIVTRSRSGEPTVKWSQAREIREPMDVNQVLGIVRSPST